ncbi:hypothetical protein LCGC14_2673450, partial [marine sediment metagenome]
MIDVNWTAPSDIGSSGLDGYSVEWTQLADTVPDTIIDDMGPSGVDTHSDPLEDGDWWFHIRAVDKTGNGSSAVHLGPFKIDIAAPLTTHTVIGALGPNNAFSTPVTISFNRIDPVPASGVLKTEYSFNSGSTWNLYSGPFIISNQGTTNILYRSTDKAGNIEGYKAVSATYYATSTPTPVIAPIPGPAPPSSPAITIDSIGPKTFAKSSGARTLSKKKAPRYLKLYRHYRSK